jgi:hypothetical protein
MSLEPNPPVREVAKRWGRIPDASHRSGLSRSFLYQIAAAHPGLFKKAGTATIVDLVMLDRIVAGLPDASIKEPA